MTTKKDDQYLVLLVQLLLDKSSGKKLSEWLAEYCFAISDKFSEKIQIYIYEMGSIWKDEREMYISETIGINFKKELLSGAQYCNHRGQFQGEPVYTSIYYQNNDPIAVGATFSETETIFRSLNYLSVPVATKRALVSKIISNLMGSPKKIEDLFFWKGISNVSVLLFPLGHVESRLILFIFDRSRIEKDIMENALKDIERYME